MAGAPGQLYSTWLCASVCFGQHPLTRDVLRAHKPHPSRRLGAAAALGPLRPQPPPQPVDPGGGLVAEGEVHSGREEAEKLFITRARRASLRNLREARHGVRRDMVSDAKTRRARQLRGWPLLPWPLLPWPLRVSLPGAHGARPTPILPPRPARLPSSHTHASPGPAPHLPT